MIWTADHRGPLRSPTRDRGGCLGKIAGDRSHCEGVLFLTQAKRRADRGRSFGRFRGDHGPGFAPIGPRYEQTVDLNRALGANTAAIANERGDRAGKVLQFLDGFSRRSGLYEMAAPFEAIQAFD